LVKIQAFKSFYHNDPELLGDKQTVTISLCDGFGITYTELMKQPSWWVQTMKMYKLGKEMAISERSKQKNKAPDISKYKIPRVKR